MRLAVESTRQLKEPFWELEPSDPYSPVSFQLLTSKASNLQRQGSRLEEWGWMPNPVTLPPGMHSDCYRTRPNTDSKCSWKWAQRRYCNQRASWREKEECRRARMRKGTVRMNRYPYWEEHLGLNHLLILAFSLPTLLTNHCALRVGDKVVRKKKKKKR